MKQNSSYKILFFLLSVLFIFKIFEVNGENKILVKITEIAPIKIQDENEWLEFKIQSNEMVDLQNWKIQKNNNSPIPFSTIKDQLKFGVSVKKVENQSVFLSGSGFVLSGSGFSESDASIENFSLQENGLFFTATQTDNSMYFFIDDLPFSLTDNGATIKILDENDEILEKQTYEKAKSFTKNGQRFSAEIWNLNETKNQLFPLVYKQNDAGFFHTKGFENSPPPVFPEDIEIIFSEISPKVDPQKGNDFLEIYVKSGAEKINLKYAEIKHNGTRLYFFENDFWIKPKEIIILEVGQSETQLVQKNTAPYKIHSAQKNSFSSGSGTYELILFSGTSWEKTVDFVCHQSENLSQIEKSRVEKNRENWSGSCVEIGNLITNESIARDLNTSDSNLSTDFFRHFNGSKGAENQAQNQEPIAQIIVQGSGRIDGTPPLSLNLSGENSTDPNGKTDLKNFTWRLNGAIFSTEENPQIIKIETIGNYLVELKIEDFSGAKNTAQLKIILTNKNSNSSPSLNFKNIKSFLEKKTPPHSKNVLFQKTKNLKQAQLMNFFDEFLTQSDLNIFQEKNQQPFIASHFFEENPPLKNFQKNLNQVSRKRRKKNFRVQKNLGLIFEE